MPLQLGVTAPYQASQQEARFRKQQAAALRRQDQLAGVLSCLLVLVTAVRYYRLYLTSGAVLRAGLVGSLYLLPLVWCQLVGAPESYSKYRLLIIPVLHLNALLLPGLDSHSKGSMVGTVPPPTSFAGWLAVLAFTIKLPKLTLLGLGFKLPLLLHLLTHAILVAYYLSDLPAMCVLPLYRQPAIGLFFSTAAQIFGSISTIASVALGPLPALDGASCGAGSSGSGSGSAFAAQSDSCCCVLVLGTLMLLLCFVVPSCLVALAERWGRAAFVISRQHEAGWAQADLQAHLFYDWVPACVLFAGVLPAVVGVVWLGSQAVARQKGICLPSS